MNQQEHAQEARNLLRRAHQESASGGNHRVAAEFLWGAFAHCLIAVALNEALHHESHGAFRHIAHHMDAASRRQPVALPVRVGSKTPSAFLSRTPEQ